MAFFGKNRKQNLQIKQFKGYNILLALAYDQLCTFYNLIEETKLSPEIVSQQEVAFLATRQITNFQKIENYFSQQNLDIYEHVYQYRKNITDYHTSTSPVNWGETLVKVFLGYGFISNYFLLLNAECRRLGIDFPLMEELEETDNQEKFVTIIKQYLLRKPELKPRLILWARRLQSESVTQIQYFILNNEEILKNICSDDLALALNYPLVEKLTELLQFRIKLLEDM